MVLEDTVLFPEGGGQPSDCGTVGGLPCLRVDNVGGVAVHLVEGPLETATEGKQQPGPARRRRRRQRVV